MSLDERLRHALHEEADRVEPGADGRDRIAERIATAERRRQTRRYGVTGLGLAAVLALTLGAVGVLDDEEPTSVHIGPSGTTDPTTAPTTGPAPTTPPTTGTTPPPELRPAEAVFPAGASAYGDPVALAADFMREYVGVPNPVPGAFRQGDARSGEVPVRPRADLEALETTVLVRQVADGDWYVLGAHSANIVLERPTAMIEITDPVEIVGQARAFEGTVHVDIRDDNGNDLADSFMTGGGGSELTPLFGPPVSFGNPATQGGALILSTSSAEDGSVQEATVVRVTFGTAPPTGDTCDPPEPDGDHRVVLVYFHCEEQSPTAVFREIPEGVGPLQGALQALVAGPTAEHREVGLFSPFSSLSADAVTGVNLSGGTAIVDFDPRLPEVLPNSSTSAGSQLLLEQLNSTVFQFENITGIEYRLGGDCEAFWNWLQGSCHTVARGETP